MLCKMQLSATLSVVVLAFVSPRLSWSACWRDTDCTGPTEAAFPGPWDNNNLAPTFRYISPKSVLSLPLGDKITNYESETGIDIGSDIEGLVFDFGIEVGGIISFDYTLSGADNSTLGLAFTEAKDYIGRKSDNSNGGTGQDGALLQTLPPTDDGHYVMPDPKLRGGFRYLTLFLDSSSSSSSSSSTLGVKNISLEISFQPTWSNLRAYQGYFHSSDELLDRIWYAGAYTLQTNSVPGRTGRVQVSSTRIGWQNDAFIGPGDTVLLDGAKRDRWVWIGDMGTAVPSAFVSTGELESTRNALQAIYDLQVAYHMWVLIGTYNYYLYTQDQQWLEETWPKYLLAMNKSLSKLTPDGIVNVTGQADWGRWTYSPQRASASMLTGSLIASWSPELPNAAEHASQWNDAAAKLQAAIVEHLWDDNRGAFKESPDNTDLHPQDANSMAIAFGVLPPDSADAHRVSDHLVSNWTPIGPSSPELAGNVSPFITSIELDGHFRIGRPERSLELIRSAWGWYIEHPNGTQSTVAEGYLLDGTWGYRGDRGYRNDPSYVSHAHCWSSGPTSTLTEHLVGLRVTAPGGSEWQLKPATFGEVSHAEAGFTTGLGKFSAKFNVTGGEAFVEWDVPEGTKGFLSLPGESGQWVGGGKGSATVAV